MRRRALASAALLGTSVAACLLLDPLDDISGGIGKSSSGSEGGTPDTDGGAASSSAPQTIWSGVAHMCATTMGGTLSCWGTNAFGQLGVGDTSDRAGPTPVLDLSNDIAYVSIGAEHTCAIDRNAARGALSCWGKNDLGQLGVRGVGARALAPVRNSLSDAVKVQCGETHTCVLTARRTVYCFGANDHGQLGGAAGASSDQPVLVEGLVEVEDLADAYGRHACAIGKMANVRAVYCWGDNAFGQLGDGTRVDRSRPTRVAGTETARGIHAGFGNGCAELPDGSLRCWGANAHGELGDGTRTDRLSPGGAPSGIVSVRALSFGFSHACAVDGTGVVRCWGRSDRGQVPIDTGTMEDGGRLDTLSPVVVTLPEAARGVSGRFYPTCAWTESGKAYCWGANGTGQLLAGDRVDRFSPTPMAF